MNYTPIGRVRPIHRGTHDPSAAYEALDVVRRADGLASYMAKQAVPAGKTLADGEYWGLLSDAGIKAVADAACAPFEGSGSVAECHPVAGYPLEVRSGIEPVQSGSGDPSPSNVRPISGWTGATLTRCGKNLMNLTFPSDDLTIIRNADGTITATNNTSGDIGGARCELTGVLPAGTYTISKNDTNAYVYLQTSSSDYTNSITAYTFDYDGMSYLRIMCSNIKAGESVTYKIQLEQGSTATAYTPYQGDTFTADFGQTVYGGTLDWNTGVLTVDRASVQFMPTEISAYGSAGYSMLSANNLQPIAALSDFYSVCNRFKRNYVWQIDAEYYYVSKDFVYLFSNRWTTLEEAKTWFTDNPTIMVYKLATPATIQLTPKEIAALEGLNTLYSSTGDTAVAGRADMGWLTQSILDRLAALESAAVNG